MSIRFVPLFTFTISHAYYEGRCRDFSYVLPQDTVRLLLSGRLISVTRDGQLIVLFEAGDDGQPRVHLDGQFMRIGLAALNTWLPNVTAPASNPTETVALYRNVTDPRALQGPVAARLVGPVFSHPLQDAARPVTVTIRNAAGAAMRTETVTAAEQRAAVSIDLRGERPGPLVLEELYPGAVQKTFVYYQDAELRRQNVTIVIEIRIDAGFYQSAGDFTLAFDARQDILKYYVVARNYSNGDLGQLVVKDMGFGEEGRPEVKFTKIPASGFSATEIPASVLTAGDAKVLLFKSQTSVPRRCAGRKKIQLNRNGDILVRHLPSPSPEHATADLIVHVSKP